MSDTPISIDITVGGEARNHSIFVRDINDSAYWIAIEAYLSFKSQEMLKDAMGGRLSPPNPVDSVVVDNTPGEPLESERPEYQIVLNNGPSIKDAVDRVEGRMYRTRVEED